MMRLLERSLNGDFKLVFYNDESLPPYAILSHTWINDQEVTYKELVEGTGQEKSGYDKIRFCSERAAADGLRYFWIDTCCIDKSTSVELSTAINSMFRWYQRASKCYVYLTDVVVPDEVADAEAFPITWTETFRRSRWFTRGWTLQELLAPPCVEFFAKNGKRLGSRISLEQEIHKITKIAIEALRGQSLADFSITERMSWAAQRTTTMKEDKVYCLLGIFEVFLPLIYGEGEAYATLRLEEEIERRLGRQGTGIPLDLFGFSVSPFPRNELLIGREYQGSEDRRKRKRQDSLTGQSKRYCQSLQRDIPPQVLLENPVILFDGFDKCLAISLNWISSMNFFREVMASKAREVLEDRFKEKGYAKIWEGDFLLQDQSQHNLDLRRPWSFIMKPGERRYMSIKFRENTEMQTSCPHCGTDNNALEGQATICQSCHLTYERIVEVDEEDVTDDKIPRSSPSKALPDTPPIHDVTEEELKYCFRRIILMASAPPISELENMLPFNDEATCLIRRDCDQAFIPMSDHMYHSKHKNNLSYVCDICLQSFGLRTDLNCQGHPIQYSALGVLQGLSRNLPLTTYRHQEQGVNPCISPYAFEYELNPVIFALALEHDKHANSTLPNDSETVPALSLVETSSSSADKAISLSGLPDSGASERSAPSSCTLNSTSSTIGDETGLPYASSDWFETVRTRGVRKGRHYWRTHNLRYPCNLCKGICFGLAADLKRHERCVHQQFLGSDATYQCTTPGCSTPDKIFRRKDNFTRHVKRCRQQVGKGKAEERADPEVKEE